LESGFDACPCQLKLINPANDESKQMSFIVQIIDAALPGDATLRQRLIDQYVAQHHSENAGPGAALAQLYQQLVAQYPCLSTFKENDSDACVWADGPLIANFGKKIAVLDIAQNEEQVLAFILKLAGELNLKVVDVQEELVYYPKSQEAVDFIKAHEKSVVKEKPLTEKSVLDFIVARLKPLFEPAGFVWNKKERWFQRSVSYGNQCFRVDVEKQRDRFALFLDGRLHIDRVQDTVRKLLSSPNRGGYIFYGYEYFTGEYFQPRVQTSGELREFVVNFEAIIVSKVLPFFEATLSLEQANRLTNNNEKCKFFLTSSEALTLAYLVQSSRIQETADLYRNHIKFRDYSEDAYRKPIDDFVNKLIALNPTLCD
jgi:hypothetical protein